MKSKIALNRLVIIGNEYKRSFEFDQSLIIIKGDGYAGKSLLLKLIMYCLGGKSDLIDLNVQKELNIYCNDVFLEFRIDNQIYTIKRSLKAERNTIYIFLCPFDECADYSPWKKNPDDTNIYLANELQIPLHPILKKKSGSKDLTEECISFRDILRFVYIGQGELGTIHFMNNENVFINRKNKEAFKIINDLVNPDLQEINNQIQVVQNTINEHEKVKFGLENYLINKEADSLIFLIDLKEKYSAQIKTYNSQKNILIKNEKGRTSEVYQKLKDDISNLDNDIAVFERENIILNQSIINKNLLYSDYKDEKFQLSATLESMKKIKISQHNEHCPLCNSQVVIKVENDTSEDIELTMYQIEDKMKTLLELINEENIVINKNKHEIKKLNEKKQIYSNALHEYRKNLELPYLSEIESYNSLIKDIRAEKNKVSSLIDIHHDKESHEGNIKKLKIELDSLIKKKDQLQVLQQKENDILTKLNHRYRELMFKFNFHDTQEELCYISEDNYLPYYDGISVLKHTSGCLLLCMEIAYLGAILELNEKEDSNCHPCLLMIDTVSNNIGTNSSSKDSIDPETYKEIFNYLVKLSNNNQIFIVDNTPPEIKKFHKELIFRRVKHGENLKGFIDIECNEYSESYENSGAEESND